MILRLRRYKEGILQGEVPRVTELQWIEYQSELQSELTAAEALLKAYEQELAENPDNFSLQLSVASFQKRVAYYQNLLKQSSQSLPHTGKLARTTSGKPSGDVGKSLRSPLS